MSTNKSKNKYEVLEWVYDLPFAHHVYAESPGEAIKLWAAQKFGNNQQFSCVAATRKEEANLIIKKMSGVRHTISYYIVRVN